MSRSSFAALALLVLARASAAENIADLGPIVVTATRTATTADESLASVTVITRADIERLQPRSVQELLVGLPGVSIANNGGLGKSTAVFLRGTADTQVLVLLDGIKIGSASLGTTAFEQIPVDQVERIEIVRGPRSSLYGSEAIGGVIQIFTRKADNGLTPSFSAGGGTYNTWQGQAGIAGGDGHAWGSVSLSGQTTKGINATTPDYAGYEPDADGFRQVSGAARTGYRYDNGAEVSVDWLRATSHNHYDDSFPSFGYFGTNESISVQQLLGGTIKLPRLGFWQVQLSGGQTEDRETDFGNGAASTRFDTLRNSFSLQNAFQLAPRQDVTAGFDYLKDHLASDAGFSIDSREDLGGYVQYQGGFGASDVQLSLRDDNDQQFGNHLTGGAAWGYGFSRALRVSASYGLAFRAPTFDELYFPGYGNPALRPEKSASGELGLSGRPGIFNWALNVYQTNSRDLITPVLVDPATFTYAPENVARARLRGAEAQLGLRWQQWRGLAYASVLDSRDRTAGDENHLLPRRAQQTARLEIDRDWQRFNAGTTVYFSGRRYDDLANSSPLGGYATIDLRGGWQFERRWLLQAQLSNLFDKHYETAKFYRQPGRAVFFTVRYHPSSY